MTVVDRYFVALLVTFGETHQSGGAAERLRAWRKLVLEPAARLRQPAPLICVRCGSCEVVQPDQKPTRLKVCTHSHLLHPQCAGVLRTELANSGGLMASTWLCAHK